MGRVKSKTKAQLLEDLAGARKRLAELEASLAEKKQTEEALREAEDRYRALFEQAADSIILFDADTA